MFSVIFFNVYFIVKFCKKYSKSFYRNSPGFFPSFGGWTANIAARAVNGGWKTPVLMVYVSNFFFLIHQTPEKVLINLFVFFKTGETNGVVLLLESYS